MTMEITVFLPKTTDDKTHDTFHKKTHYRFMYKNLERKEKHCQLSYNMPFTIRYTPVTKMLRQGEKCIFDSMK